MTVAIGEEELGREKKMLINLKIPVNSLPEMYECISRVG